MSTDRLRGRVSEITEGLRESAEFQLRMLVRREEKVKARGGQNVGVWEVRVPLHVAQALLTTQHVAPSGEPVELCRHGCREGGVLCRYCKAGASRPEAPTERACPY